MELAELEADAVAGEHSNVIVIGAGRVVSVDGKKIAKPAYQVGATEILPPQPRTYNRWRFVFELVSTLLQPLFSWLRTYLVSCYD